MRDFSGGIRLGVNEDGTLIEDYNLFFDNGTNTVNAFRLTWNRTTNRLNDPPDPVFDAGRDAKGFIFGQSIRHCEVHHPECAQGERAVEDVRPDDDQQESRRVQDLVHALADAVAEASAVLEADSAYQSTSDELYLEALSATASFAEATCSAGLPNCLMNSTWRDCASAAYCVHSFMRDAWALATLLAHWFIPCGVNIVKARLMSASLGVILDM